MACLVPFWASSITARAYEGLTHERDTVRLKPFALRSSCFINELTDDLSTAMVKGFKPVLAWKSGRGNAPD